MGGHTQSEEFLGYSSSLAMAVPYSSPPVGRGHGSILQPKLAHSLLHLRQIPNYCCLTQSAVCTCVCVHTCVSVHLCVRRLEASPHRQSLSLVLSSQDLPPLVMKILLTLRHTEDMFLS